MAATNRDLEAAITAGSFQRDLFYPLNVFPIEVPPLRQRREDIPVLVEYFIDRFARKAGKKIRQVNKKILDLLQSYPWPGNIRELQNVIKDLSSCAKPRIFRWMKAGCPNSLVTGDQKASFTSRGTWQLRKKK
jgi:transcriptional regulator with GAF, ATPase, and Fis domain